MVPKGENRSRGEMHRDEVQYHRRINIQKTDAYIGRHLTFERQVKVIMLVGRDRRVST